jgi:tetratricopeptide (TPR) repeat protein
MDCRRWILCAGGLLTGCLGCVTQRGALAPGLTENPLVAVKKEDDLPKRNPKASTCVAFGNYRAGEAADDKVSPAARQQMQEQARVAYEQALRIDANYVPAYLGLSELYIAEDDYPRALATYIKGLEKQPKSAPLWQALGMLHARKKEWEPALAALSKAMELDPQNRQYPRTLGLCLARAGRTEESIACLTKVMNQAEAHLLVARMLHHLKRDEESQRYARLALEEKPDFAAARDFLFFLEHPTSTPAPGAVLAGIEEARAPAQ